MSKISETLKKNKKKLLIGTAVIGGAVIGVQYYKRKFIEWREREAKKSFIISRKQRHFLCTEQVCNRTIKNISTDLFDAISAAVNIDNVLYKLRSGDPDKILLWSELKVLTFTHACTLIYGWVFLVVTLRIQLNVIGGCMFKDTMYNTTDVDKNVTSNLQHSYLTLCDYLLHDGVNSLFNIIHSNVSKVIGDVSLKKELGLRDIEVLFFQIRSSLSMESTNPVKCMKKFVFPTDLSHNVKSLSNSEAKLLKLIYSETVDILESEETCALTNTFVCKGFSYFIDKLVDYFVTKEHIVEISSASQSEINMSKQNIQSQNNSKFCDPFSSQMPLAKLVPLVNSVSKSNSFDNEKSFASWLSLLLIDENMQTFGANVYEAFCN